MVDCTQPNITVDRNYISSDIPITLTLTDNDNGSGVSKLEVSKDNSEYYDIDSPEVTSWFATSCPKFIGDQEYIIPKIQSTGSYKFRATDRASNYNEVAVDVISKNDWNNKTFRDQFIDNQLTKNNGHMEIPYGITDIPAACFFKNTKLTSINISDTVTNIGNYALARSYLEEIYIPKSVNKIEGALYMCEKLENIEVDEDSSKYVSVDGVLFTKDMTELIAYPIGNTRKSYTIPKSVSKISNVGYFPFYYCYNLENILVEEGNINFTSKDGVLFTKDMTELVIYPTGNTRESYSIPNDVTRLRPFSFMYQQYLNYIYIPDSVTDMGWSVLNNNYVSIYGLPKLNTVNVPSHLCDKKYFLYCNNLNNITCRN